MIPPQSTGAVSGDRPMNKIQKTFWCGSLGLLILAGGAIAQAPSEDKSAVPSRSVRITAEQGHVIKEIVLKDAPAAAPARAGQGSEPAIGDKAPSDVSLQTFPESVWQKVPQVRMHKFYIANGQVVIVSPSDNTVADIIK
jgi:hypothetical protein